MLPTNLKTIDRTCKCKLRTGNYYLVSAPGCSDDVAAVSALPEEWSPRRSGPTLAKYLTKREQDHKYGLTKLKEDADALNNDIDARVRTIAETLLADIKKSQQDIDCVIKRATPVNSVLNIDDRNNCFKCITKVFSEWVQNLVIFKQEALALERNRVDGLKGVLKKHFQLLVKVGHMSPKDLLHDFDERMYAINQQLLSNCRAYSELEAQLRIQADAFIVRARSSVNELCLDKVLQIRGRSALPWENTASYRKRSSSLEPVKTKSTTNSPPALNTEEFKEYISHLVKAYKSAILNLCTDFSDQLESLQEDIDNCVFIERPRKSVISRIQTTIDQAFRKLSDSFAQSKLRIEKVLLDITVNDVLNMQKSFFHFSDRLQSTYLILHDAGYMWDAHIMRSALVQKLTMAGVEDLMTLNDSIELANELAFNIGLEQLRFAPDIDKLKQQYDILTGLLDHIEESYQQHNEMEIKKLEEYMNLPPIMTNIVLAEYECFFERYPKSPLNLNQSLNSSPDLVSPRRQTLISLRAPLPRVVLQTHLQDVALYNWRNGFLESLQNNLSSVPHKVNCQARRWIDERTMQVNLRYSIKLMSHSVRLERLNAAHQKRLSELKNHDSILSCHLNAMNDLIDNLPIEISEYLSIDSPELYPICHWVNKMQLDVDNLIAHDPDPETKRLKMCSYAPRLVMYRNLFEESLDVAIEKYKKNIQQRLQSARISTFLLISQMKLPVEGGTYAVLEATKATNAILKTCDAFELCANRSMDMVNHRRQQLLLLADQLLHPLNRTVEEVVKTADKKKALALPKKK